MGKKRLEEAPDLNLVPIMNLVTILIPFLLMAAQFVSMAVIDSTLPAIGPPVPQEEKPETDKPPLQLSIVLTGEGITVAGADAVLKPEGAAGEGEEQGPTVPCKESGCPAVESYDWEEMVRLLNLIKDQYPDDENVILVPESNIPYEVLVAAMDNTREDPNNKVDGKARLLFPFVVIAGGAQ